ncbi:DUF1800 domain-containing protein [Pseudoalteromonas sp. S1727]|uniref:DUF1800 domain-containing protein n=1 Tax=Pseudoalteromonas sp. S1727 TaxID=2066514 RepID=UPI001107B448|nr:DUF1800 domain-containing protein [Pseudoalteromonas sp. S1727]TMN73085.1 DUF1800 domain-containing protein [Pseudoalteromonas sp. S1727]
MSVQATIAINRFGLGATPSELTAANKDPKQWLISQLQLKPAIHFNSDVAHSDEIMHKLAELREQKKSDKNNIKSNNPSETPQTKTPKVSYHRQIYLQLSIDTLEHAINSEHSLNWRLLDFFSNHFSVSSAGPVMTALAPTLEREAIAPNLLGRFDDLLISVIQHPAMLIYLNNEKSFGPNSKVAKKNGRGLNENLAREILELHTLGVDSGYSQKDVIELAKGITGWSVANPLKDKEQGFKYRRSGHEPGVRTLLNKTYSQKDSEQGKSMLRDLAVHPATAKHISYKLAHHFISDNPPASLVNKMTDSWLATNGDIKAVMTTMINADEAWHAEKQKFKTPREFVISSLRALELKTNNRQLYSSLVTLGQQPFKAGSPAGYSDSEDDWNGASALISRVNWASTIAARAKKVQIEAIIKNSFSESISQLSYQTISRAESRKQALTLFLMSPEFLRR